VEEIELPRAFPDLVAAHATIQWIESAAALAPEFASAPSLLSDELREALIDGAARPVEAYREAKLTAAELTGPITTLLGRFDAVLTPSATGVPPTGLAFTGDPRFCRAWTLLGVPSLSVPLAFTAAGLPAGVQLVGAPFRDGRVLASASWLLERLVRR
jgi:Asp-tRNA(Asn)/Glu-tRNA(Gln) amidotransferase A subunit family amidase